MNKRILAIGLCAIVVCAVCVGCKQKAAERVSVAVTDAKGNAVTDASGEVVTEMAVPVTDEKGNAVTETVTDAKGQPVTDASGKPKTVYVTESDTATEAASGKATTAADAGKGGKTTTAASGGKTTTTKKAAETDGWKKKDNGSYVKGSVRADVVKYGKTSLEDGKELIEQLAEGGLSGAKKLASDQDKTSVTYQYSGKRIGSDKTEFVKFEYILQKGTGYLVTVIAENEADMSTDITYITSNLAKLAK